jgi:hypothetical protein
MGKKLVVVSMKKIMGNFTSEEEISFDEWNNIEEFPPIQAGKNTFAELDIAYDLDSPGKVPPKSSNILSSDLYLAIKNGRSSDKNFTRITKDDFSDKSNDGEEDAGDISLRSEKVIDDRGSMMSVSSTKAEKELELTLKGVIHSLNYYKFRSAHIPSFFLVTFFLSFLGSIFIMY